MYNFISKHSMPVWLLSIAGVINREIIKGLAGTLYLNMRLAVQTLKRREKVSFAQAMRIRGGCIMYGMKYRARKALGLSGR